MALIEQIRAQSDSVNDDFVLIDTFFFKENDFVQKDAVICSIETSKAVVEICAETDGYIRWKVNIGDNIKIGDLIGEIFSEINDMEGPLNGTTNFGNVKAETISEMLKDDAERINSNSAVKLKEIHYASKAALELINEKKIDLTEFDSTFLTTSTLKAWLDGRGDVSKVQPSNLPLESAPWVSSKLDNGNVLTGIPKSKQNEIKYLSSVNGTGLVSRLQKKIDLRGIDLATEQNFLHSTPLPLILFEVSRLLAKYPKLNSYYRGSDIVTDTSVNIGVAFDNGHNGLKVAVIRQAIELSLIDIEEEIYRLSNKYEENKLEVKDIEGATFTITDLFHFRLNGFKPLVNFENSAILGLSGNNEELILDLSFDHRVTNGREVALFLNDLSDRISHRNKVMSEHYIHVECMKCLRNSEENSDFIFVQVFSGIKAGYMCNICFEGW